MISTVRVLAAIARADVLERVRRHSFLVTLAAAAWLGWLVVQGKVTMRLGDYAGVVNAPWAGALFAATLSCLVSLVGFWIVKGSVQRDRDTRVGEILAATPLTKAQYTLGKLVSNFAVLASIVAVMAAAAPILVLLKGEKLDLVPLLAPFVLIALPVMAVVAALAVLFETVPALSGGFGNVLWFFAWGLMISFPMIQGWPWADTTGLFVLQKSMGAAALAAHPDYVSGFSLSIGGGLDDPVKGTFVWPGLAWTAGTIAQRAIWLIVAAGIALVASLPFDRFRGEGSRAMLAPAAGRGTERSSGLRVPVPSFLPQVYAGELRLMLNGHRVWWWIVAAGLAIAGFVLPPSTARAHVLPFAWLWPALIWSAMGARERRDGTEELVFVAPHPIGRLLPATYLAGVTVAVLAGAGIGLRALASGSLWAFVAWAIGALFIPALALACGVWSGGSKLFEAFYVVFWYVGPLQPTPPLDFMGASDLAVGSGIPIHYAMATAALLALAVVGRKRQLSR